MNGGSEQVPPGGTEFASHDCRGASSSQDGPITVPPQLEPPGARRQLGRGWAAQGARRFLGQAPTRIAGDDWSFFATNLRRIPKGLKWEHGGRPFERNGRIAGVQYGVGVVSGVQTLWISKLRGRSEAWRESATTRDSKPAQDVEH